MNEQESVALAQFCADQYYAFDSRAWQRRSLYDRNASTVAALYLSMTSWYGHEDELERVAAEALALHASGEDFRNNAQASSFDSARFSTMVRAEIAARQSGNSVPIPTAQQNRNASL
jgi:hypothetical protein